MRRSTTILACLLLALATVAAERDDVWCLVPAAFAGLVLVVLIVSIVGKATEGQVE